MLKRTQINRRSAFLVLALLAATLLSLRSVCDLWFAHIANAAVATRAETAGSGATLHHDADPSVQCCVSLSNPDRIAPLEVAFSGPQFPQGTVYAVLSVVFISTAIFARTSHRLRAPPRGPQSFYLRSARILR